MAGMDDADDRLTADEQVTMLRIAVRILNSYGEDAIAELVEEVADDLSTAIFEGKVYRPGG